MLKHSSHQVNTIRTCSRIRRIVHLEATAGTSKCNLQYKTLRLCLWQVGSTTNIFFIFPYNRVLHSCLWCEIKESHPIIHNSYAIYFLSLCILHHPSNTHWSSPLII